MGGRGNLDEQQTTTRTPCHFFSQNLSHLSPILGRQGLVGGMWGQDTVLAGTFLGVLNVLLRASVAQLGLGIVRIKRYKQTDTL